MKLLRNLIWSLVVIVLLVITLPLFIGWYLSPQDPIEKADVAVVVSGGDNDARIKKGVELYKEGWVPKIIFSGAAAKGNVSNAEAMKNIAIAQGVDHGDILTEEKSKTTMENASFSAKVIKENSFKSIILVTSPYHQRRTYELFKKDLADVKIINQSALDENWRKKGWWETNVGRFLTAGELSKILINWVQTWSGK